MEAASIKDYAISKGLAIDEDIVFINDFVDNVSDHIASSSVGIVSSLGSEVICRVSEEFLLCGNPIFVTDVGSLSECIYSKDAGSIIFL